MSDDSILVKLTANGDEFKEGIEGALSSLNSFTTALAANPVIAAAAAVAALVQIARSAADFGDELNDLHEKTGMSVESLSTLKFAAEESGTGIDAVAQGMKFLSKNAVEAAGGNEKAGASFAALGVNVEDLLSLKPEEQFMVMAEAVSKVEDPALKSKLAIDIFGRGAQDLMPMMSGGAEGIAKMQEKAEQLGLKMSGETAKQADEFNDSLHALWLQLKQIAYDIGAIIIPPLTTLFDWISKLVSVFKDGFMAVLHMVNAVLIGMVGQGIAALYLGITKVTDALGLTTEAAKGAAEFLKLMGDMANEAGKDSVASFNAMISSSADAKTAEEETAKAKQHVIDLTDEERMATLNAAEAYKALVAENKAFNKAYQDAIEKTLGYKKKAQDYDEEYFAAYNESLLLQGYSVQQAAEMTLKERQDMADKESAMIQESIKKYLDFKKSLGEFDQDYFDAYEALLNEQLDDDEDIQKAITAERKKQLDKQKNDLVNVNDLMKTAVKGAADAIKSLWSDTQMTFHDAWTNALDSFVDVMAQMVVNAQTTGAAISASMAVATFGITLVLGLLASVMGGDGTYTSKIDQAFENFLDGIRSTLHSFEYEVLSTLDLLALNMQTAADIFQTYDYSGSSMSFSWLYIDPNDLEDAKQAIADRYSLEEELINEVFDLLQEKADFIKSIEADITDVTRTFYTDQELYTAQQTDLKALWASFAMSTDDSDRLNILGDIESAYMELWDTAQSLYADNADSLAAAQAEIVAGLQNVEDAGKYTYDNLIDVNLEMLDVQRQGVDLEQQMTDLLTQLQSDVITAYQELENYADANGVYALGTLYQALIDMGLITNTTSFPMMASGGIVTSPTLAMIGEAGPEAVVPLSQMNRMGGIGTLQVVMPNVKDVRTMTENDWMDALKTATRAAERLGRNGYTWGMPSRA